jgi:hypothetical protein
MIMLILYLFDADLLQSTMQMLQTIVIVIHTWDNVHMHSNGYSPSTTKAIVLPAHKCILQNALMLVLEALTVIPNQHDLTIIPNK